MNALREVLTTAGLDGSRLRVLREHPERLLCLEVPVHEARATWHHLRLLEPLTRHLPLNLGSGADVARLDDALEANGAGLKALVAETDGLAFDLDAWTGEALGARATHLADIGDRRGAHAMTRALAVYEGRVPAVQVTGVDPEAELVSVPANPPSGQASEWVHLALLPTSTAWHAPLHVRFGGGSGCHGPALHAAVLRAWGTLHGVALIGATHDTLEMSVARPPRDFTSAFRLACQQYAYCPDLVDQGAGSLDALAASLVDSPRWVFWWD